MKKLLLSCLFSGLLWSQPQVQNFQEVFSLHILNQAGGQILVKERGQSILVGQVLRPYLKVNTQGFTASKWGNIGSVVAAAVNAIHIKVGQDAENDRGIIFSIIPSEQIKIKEFNSYLDKDSALFTNIRAGDKIFGGEWSPLIGNQVFVSRNGQYQLLDMNNLPKIGEEIVIRVIIPSPYPKEIILENKFNGKITIKYLNGQQKTVGKVLRPVLGIGRFIGTKYCSASRIRASHRGGLDVSTSPLAQIGGFQIIPAEHAESQEMTGAKSRTQWMVVAGVDAKPLPIFSGYIIPRFYENDFNENWRDDLANRTLVQCRYQGQKGWKPLPIISVDPNKSLPEEMNTALKSITHFRILLPLYRSINKNGSQALTPTKDQTSGEISR